MEEEFDLKYNLGPKYVANFGQKVQDEFQK